MTRRAFGLLDRLLIVVNAVLVALVVIEAVLQIVYRSGRPVGRAPSCHDSRQ